MLSYLPHKLGLILSWLSFFLPGQVVFAEVPAEAWIEDFNSLAEAIIQSHQPPGLAMAIVTPGQVVAVKTHGVRQLGQEGAIDENTIFRVASVSKPCTSALVAQLAAQGRIDIEAPISRYLPNLQIGGSRYTQRLKIKHLLSHTTGLPGRSLEHEAYRRQDFEALIKKLESVRTVGAPGKVYQYQNVLYSLLGPVVENITQTSFTDYLQQSLLQPLGITNYALSEANYAACENLAKPHLRTRRRTASLGAFYKVHQPTSYYDNILPAAGMGFSIKEMAILLQAFMGGYPVVLEDEALNKCYAPLAVVHKRLNKSRKKKQRRRVKYVTEHYGLGWRIQHFKGKSIVYHRGEVDGYTASVAFSKEEQLGIVVLMNARKSILPYQLSNCFFEMLFDEHHQRPARFRKLKLGVSS